MHARVVLGVGKGVLFREVSSVHECPYNHCMYIISDTFQKLILIALLSLCSCYASEECSFVSSFPNEHPN